MLTYIVVTAVFFFLIALAGFAWALCVVSKENNNE